MELGVAVFCAIILKTERDAILDEIAIRHAEHFISSQSLLRSHL